MNHHPCRNGVFCDGSRRGAALVVVFAATLVLSILVGALYVLFSNNVATMNHTINRTGARFTAEAGSRLAIHHLSLDTNLPQDTEPFFMPGDSSGWITMEGVQGKALVVIDPRNSTENPWSNTGVEVRSRGSVGNRTRDVIVRYAPDTPSRYCLLVDDEIPPGFFVDSMAIDGPVHCNGIINFSSISADSTGDPLAAEISTTTDGGFRFLDTGMSNIPHPQGSSVWVRPYNNHRAGYPSWNTSAVPVSFPRLSTHFQRLSGEAVSQGSHFRGVGRMLLDGRTVQMRATEESPTVTLMLAEGIDLIFINNGSMPLYMKSTGSSSTGPLTIVCTGSIYIMGDIKGGSSAGENLAIVSLGDVVIASDPDFTGGSDWLSPWNIETSSNILLKCYIAAPSGELRNENVIYPSEKVILDIWGGLLEKRMGRLGTSMTGFEPLFTYNDALSEVRPPHFPILENWIVTSWMEDPDYGAYGDIFDDNF